LSWSEDVKISQAASLAVNNITDEDRIETNRLVNEGGGGERANDFRGTADIAAMLVADEGSSYPAFVKKWQQSFPYYPSLNPSTPITWSPDLLHTLNSYAGFVSATTFAYIYGTFQMRSHLMSKGEQFTQGILTRPLAVRMAAYFGGGFVCALGTVVWYLLSDKPGKYGFKFDTPNGSSNSFLADPLTKGWTIKDVLANPECAGEIKGLLRIHQEPKHQKPPPPQEASREKTQAEIEEQVSALKSSIVRESVTSTISTCAVLYLSLSLAPTAIVPIGLGVLGPTIWARLEEWASD
jgi:hypothetical protein